MNTNLETTIGTTKLKIKETITERRVFEKEVDLPYYCKDESGYSHYKIISEQKAIKVSDWGFQVEISVRESFNHLIEDCINSSQEEFLQAYESAITKIQNQNLAA